MPQTHLWLDNITESNGSITINVVLENTQHARTTLWYRVPVEHKTAITPSSDPFVVGALFLAMRQATDLVVHGQVSPSLLRNLEEFQAAWVSWKPERYTKINILADTEQESSPAPANEAVVAFSGGVDSCFTAWRHSQGLCGRQQRNLHAGVMVHGFDIPLNQTDVFNRAKLKAQKMLASLGVQLLPIATNFRDLGDNWEDCHAAGAASCLMLLQQKYSVGLYGSTEPYKKLLIPWGSNPITDPMLASDSFQFIHDGAAYTRTQKIQVISDWPEANKYLRVCWQGQDKDKNCGQCEKCVRTILNFRVIGLSAPECFENDVSDAQISEITHLNLTQIGEFEQIIDAAKTANNTDSWVSVLEKTVAYNKKMLNAPPANRLRRALYKGILWGAYPLLVPAAAIDAYRRQRSFQRSWRGGIGRLKGWLTKELGAIDG